MSYDGEGSSELVNPLPDIGILFGLQVVSMHQSINQSINQASKQASKQAKTIYMHSSRSKYYRGMLGNNSFERPLC